MPNLKFLKKFGLEIFTLFYEYCLSEEQNFARLISKFLIRSVVLSFTAARQDRSQKKKYELCGLIL